MDAIFCVDRISLKKHNAFVLHGIAMSEIIDSTIAVSIDISRKMANAVTVVLFYYYYRFYCCCYCSVEVRDNQ